MFLLAAALMLGVGCRTTTNNYAVTPDPGTDPGTNPTTDPGYTVVTPPPFTIDSTYWSYLIGTRSGRADTFFRAICQQDNIAYDGGMVTDMRIQYSTGSWVSLPDTVDYTTFMWMQTDTGFVIYFRDIKGYYPGEPGTQTFEVDIQLPADKSSGQKRPQTITAITAVVRLEKGQLRSYTIKPALISPRKR